MQSSRPCVESSRCVDDAGKGGAAVICDASGVRLTVFYTGTVVVIENFHQLFKISVLTR